MRQGKRFGLSAAHQSEMWSRWKAGQSLHEIGRAFGKSHSSIRCVVSLHGGLFLQSVDARFWHLHRRSERTSRDRAPNFWTALRRREPGSCTSWWPS